MRIVKLSYPNFQGEGIVTELFGPFQVEEAEEWVRKFQEVCSLPYIHLRIFTLGELLTTPDPEERAEALLK